MQNDQENNDSVPTGVPLKSTVKKLDGKSIQPWKQKATKSNEEPGKELPQSQESSISNISLSPIQLSLNSSSIMLTGLSESPAANLLCERLTLDGKQNLATIDEQKDESSFQESVYHRIMRSY